MCRSTTSRLRGMYGVISNAGGRKGDIIMQRSNIRRLVFGIVVAIIASGGLYVTLRPSTGSDLITEGRGLRDQEGKSKIAPPGTEFTARENFELPENP